MIDDRNKHFVILHILSSDCCGKIIVIEEDANTEIDDDDDDGGMSAEITYLPAGGCLTHNQNGRCSLVHSLNLTVHDCEHDAIQRIRFSLHSHAGLRKRTSNPNSHSDLVLLFSLSLPPLADSFCMCVSFFVTFYSLHCLLALPACLFQLEQIHSDSQLQLSFFVGNPFHARLVVVKPLNPSFCLGRVCGTSINT